MSTPTINVLHNRTFLGVPSDVLENEAFKFETQYESALRRDTGPSLSPRTYVLFALCNLLWSVVNLKEQGLLSKSKDKKMFSMYRDLSFKLRK